MPDYEIESPSKVKQIIIPLLAVVLCAIYGVSYVRKDILNLPESELEIADVVLGNMEISVKGYGRIRPTHKSLSVAKITGIIKKIHIRSGEAVKKGDLLLEMENLEIKGDVKRVELDLYRAKVDYERAKLEQAVALLDSQEKLEDISSDAELYANRKAAQALLLERGGVSKLEYQETSLSLKQLQKKMKLANDRLKKLSELHSTNLDINTGLIDQQKSLLNELNAQKSSLRLVADIDGIVLEMPVELGEFISTGEKLVTIGEMKSYTVDAQVSSIDIDHVEIGDRATITLDTIKLQAYVSRIDPKVKSNGARLVELFVDDDLAGELTNDKDVSVEIVVNEIKDTLKVSRPFGVNEKSKSKVYVVYKDGSTESKIVDFGLRGEKRIQVLAGLNEGDKIILNDLTEYSSIEKIFVK